MKKFWRINNLFGLIIMFIMVPTVGSQCRAQEDQEKRVISDFESQADLAKWSGLKLKSSLSKEHFYSGEYSAKVIFPIGGYPGFGISRPNPSDWSGFSSLKMDIYNPLNEPIKFGILIKDESGDSYPDRYDGYFALRPGLNNIDLNITGLKTNDKKRLLGMAKVKQLIIFLSEPQKEYVLYIDNVRLEKEPTLSSRDIYGFDFGAEFSPLWPGFIRVSDKTQYSKAKKYGWDNAEKTRAADRQYPDPLLQDWVVGPEFKVDIPNGEYIVYMMLEDPGYWEYYQNYTLRQVFAEDKLVVDEYLYSAPFYRNYYFKHLETEDLPGDDVWEKYVKPRFIPKLFKVRVEDGKLNLRFNPPYGYACTVSALIIYPVEHEKEGQAFIEELDKKRKAYFTNLYIESVPNKPKLSFELSEADKQRGYALFNRDYLETIYPNAVPQPEEIKKEITVFGAHGEYEPFTVNVYPLKDLGICELTMGNLTSHDGATISSENINVSTVQYKIKLTGEKIYKVRGELLRKKGGVEIKKNITRQFWVTVKIPEDTAGGEYTGEIIFKPSASQEQKVTLKLKVLPFKLAKPDIPIGMFYFTPAYFRWYEDTRNLFWQTVDAHLKDLKSHGINCLAIGIYPNVTKDQDDILKLDFDELDKFISVYKQNGFEKPLVGYGMINLANQAEQLSNGDNEEFSRILSGSYKATKEHIAELFNQELILGLGDELSNVDGPGIEYGIKLAKIARQTPGIKTTAFLNSTKDESIFPYLDISTVNNGMKITRALIDTIKKSGSQPWVYNIGQDRFSFGFYLWKLAQVGVRGRLQWNYQLPSVDPYFDLDGRESDYCASYPSLEGPINTPWFEWIREGVDDYRYILTLSNLIQKANNSNNKEIVKQAEEARGVINKIMNDIDIEPEKNNWELEKYNNKRWEIAEQIVKLDNLFKANNN